MIKTSKGIFGEKSHDKSLYVQSLTSVVIAGRSNADGQEMLPGETRFVVRAGSGSSVPRFFPYLVSYTGRSTPLF